MTCKQAQRLLSERLDRPLAMHEEARLERHLQGCAACRRFARGLDLTAAGLANLPAMPASPRVRRNVQRYVVEQSLPGRQSGGWWLRQFGGLAAGAAVLLVVTFTMVTLLAHRADDIPSLASEPRSTATRSGTTLAGPAATPSPSAAAVVVPTPTAAGTVAPTPTPAPTESPPVVQGTPEPPALTEQVAMSTVQLYFDSINRRDFAAAYALLGAALQRDQTLEEFASGFAQTARDELEILSVAPDDAGQFVVTMHLSARQTDGSVLEFSGHYVVGREAGMLKITGAAVSQDEPPVQPAATPQGSPTTGCRVEVSGTGLVVRDAAGGIFIGGTLTPAPLPCRVSSEITVTLVDARGEPLPIDGNGERHAVVAAVSAPETTAGVEWRNWCGPRDGLSLVVEIDGRRISQPLTQVPSCEDAKAPSRLRLTQPATWSGTIRSVSQADGTIELSLADGTSKTLRLAPDAVVINDTGLTLPLDALRAGDRLQVTGEVSADDSSMAPALVVVR